jgi:hypothetical protein
MAAPFARSVLGLGLAGGMALTLTPASQAQIAVTGGDFSGQSAFFVPGTNPEGNVKLFDVNIQKLRLVTPNGTTTTSVFTPTAAGFSDSNNSGKPDSGDIGTLQGTLKGVAFTPQGTPFGFSGRPTVLNFALNSFTANLGKFPGTLFSPTEAGSAPLVFLPGVNVTGVSGSTFTFAKGDLEVGDFDAGITSGLIALRSDLQFLDSGSSTPPPTSLSRRIKFDFRGENVTPETGTDLDPGDKDGDGTGEIRFVGAANTKFKIQSVGTPGEQEFKIEANTGAVDITVEAPFSKVEIPNPLLDTTKPIDKYKVEGESEGIFAILGPGQFSFGGNARRDTKFEFEQGSSKLKGQSSGDVAFTALAGVTSFTDNVDFTNFPVPTIDPTTNLGNCQTCGSTLVFGRTLIFNGVKITIGQDIEFTADLLATIKATLEASLTENETFAQAASQNLVLVRLGAASSNLFVLTGYAGTSVSNYQILAAKPIFKSVKIKTKKNKVKIKVKYVRKGSDNYYVIVPGEGEADDIDLGGRRYVVVQQIGPGCRIFPGLVGLRQIPVEDVDDEVGDIDDILDDGVAGLPEIPVEGDDTPDDDAPSDDDTQGDDNTQGEDDDSSNSSPAGVEGLNEIPVETDDSGQDSGAVPDAEEDLAMVSADSTSADTAVATEVLASESSELE